MAYKCDLTGTVIEGSGTHEVVVDVREDVRMRVMVETRVDKERWQSGVLSPEAVHIVRGSLAMLKENKAKKKTKEKK